MAGGIGTYPAGRPVHMEKEDCWKQPIAGVRRRHRSEPNIPGFILCATIVKGGSMMNMIHSLVGNSPRRPYYAILFFIAMAFAFSLLYFAILPGVQGWPSLSHTGQGKSAAQTADFLDCLYFSIGTQTTLGYGDLVPVTVSAKITSMVQAAFGYVYLAFLVSVFTAQAVLRSRRFQTYLREMVRTLR